MGAGQVCEEMVAVMEPQEIEDEEHEQVLERVAAVDVAKASGMVCTRVPHQARVGKRRTRVQLVDATTNAILKLGEHLVAEGIEKVTLESTSDYWRIWFYLLEAAGLDVQLVRAQDVQQAQDGQAGCRLASQADRARHAAALVCPPV
jgi:transposase